MGTKKDFIVISKEIPRQFHIKAKEEYGKFPKFWNSIYEMFATMVGCVKHEDIQQIKQEFPLQWEFINMLEKVK